MSKKDLFGDDVVHTESDDFASLFENSQKNQMRKLRPGDSLKGEILSINKESVFVSTNTPTDGVLPIREILDQESKPKFKVGEMIDVVVVLIGVGLGSGVVGRRRRVEQLSAPPA